MDQAQSRVQSTQPAQEGRLTRFAVSLDKHKAEIQELSLHLDRLIDRLQGPRPSDVGDSNEKPQASNIMDRMDTTLTDASCGLSEIATKLNQLDELL